MDRTWLITGCSSGIGRQLAVRAIESGENVVATARQPATLEDLGAGRDTVLRLRLDVCDPSQIEAAVAASRERFGAIDVLVNNAGYGYFSTQEEADLDEVRAMFETNVFGLSAMTQAVLPEMRERGAGTIVQLSSIAGWIGTPRAGFYQATKWAVEALAESLYHEVSSFGLRLVVVEPGRYATDFGSRSLRVGAHELDPASPYAALRELWATHAAERVLADPQDVQEVVDATMAAVNGDAAFVRVPVGVDTAILLKRRKELGDAGFVDWLNRAYHDMEWMP